MIGRVLHSGDPNYRWFTDAGKGTIGLVQDATRALLAAVFAACAFLVWWAWRRKDRRQGAGAGRAAR